MIKLLFISLQSSHAEMFVSVEKELKEIVHFPVCSRFITEANPRMNLLENMFDIERVRRIERIIEKENPDVLIVGNDGGINATYLKIANLLGIPTLVVQDGVLMSRSQRGPLNLLRWKNHFLWRLLSRISEIQLVAKLVLLAGWRTRVLEWGTGGGRTIAVMGNHSKEVLLSRGVPESKIVVTGSPLFDKITQCASRFDKARICQRLGVQEDKHFVVWLTQPFVEGGVWNVKVRDELIESIINVVNNVDGLELIIKIHPRENLEEYEKIISRHKSEKTVLVKDFDLNEIILLSTAVLTVNSTAGLLALVYQKHLLLLDYFQDGATRIYEEIGLKVHNSASLLSTLKEIIVKSNNAQHVTTRVDCFVKKFLGRLDGRASRRVVKLLLTLSQSRC